jgi:hypothetical protein
VRERERERERERGGEYGAHEEREYGAYEMGKRSFKRRRYKTQLYNRFFFSIYPIYGHYDTGTLAQPCSWQHYS